jgi:hypothetical protein
MTCITSFSDKLVETEQRSCSLNTNVIDFKSKRAESIEKKKRQFERVLFNEFVGSYIVVDGAEGLLSLSVLDVSMTGCQLQAEWQENIEKLFTLHGKLPLRFYFTKGTYLSADVEIMRLKTVEVGGKKMMRVGCEFDKQLPSYQAIRSMVAFLYQYAEHSQKEGDGHRVYFL